jgi:hypothetical protein
MEFVVRTFDETVKAIKRKLLSFNNNFPWIETEIKRIQAYNGACKSQNLNCIQPFIKDNEALKLAVVDLLNAINPKTLNFLKSKIIVQINLCRIKMPEIKILKSKCKDFGDTFFYWKSLLKTLNFIKKSLNEISADYGEIYRGAQAIRKKFGALAQREFGITVAPAFSELVIIYEPNVLTVPAGSFMKGKISINCCSKTSAENTLVHELAHSMQPIILKMYALSSLTARRQVISGLVNRVNQLISWLNNNIASYNLFLEDLMRANSRLDLGRATPVSNELGRILEYYTSYSLTPDTLKANIKNKIEEKLLDALSSLESLIFSTEKEIKRLKFNLDPQVLEERWLKLIHSIKEDVQKAFKELYENVSEIEGVHFLNRILEGFAVVITHFYCKTYKIPEDIRSEEHVYRNTALGAYELYLKNPKIFRKIFTGPKGKREKWKEIDNELKTAVEKIAKMDNEFKEAVKRYGQPR